MKKILIASFILLFSTNNALASALTKQDKKNLSDAFKTNNQYIINIVSQKIHNNNQTLEKQVTEHLKNLNKPPKQDKKYQASFEGGITIESGNSKTEALYSKASFTYQFNPKWSNKLSLRAENKKENDLRSKEEYLIKDQTKYNITDKHFTILELESNSDRFSGFNYRNSQILGYGYNIINNDKTKLSVDSGLGLRQTKFTNGDKEDSWLGKVGLDFSQQFTKNTSFIEEIDISFNDKNTISNSDSSLKITLTDQLYLKANLLLEHQSNVAANIKKLDSRTSLIIGYDF